MKPGAKRLLYSILFGAAATLPFVIMETVNTLGLPKPFSYALFLFLWLVFSLFLFSLLTLLRLARKDARRERRWSWVIVNVLILVYCVFAIIDTLIDQMPCFLGVPNCD